MNDCKTLLTQAIRIIDTADGVAIPVVEITAWLAAARALTSRDPDAPLTDAAICDLVAAALIARGFDADGEHTGGGIWCVSVTEPAVPGTQWLFGMADVNWGGGLQDRESGEAVGDVPPGEADPRGFTDYQILETTVPSDSQDASAIAEALMTAITVWRSERQPDGITGWMEG